MHDGWILLLAIVTVLAAHAVVELRLGMPALNGELIGPDSYMRLHRVLEL